jgi:hypothetical protein
MWDVFIQTQKPTFFGRFTNRMPHLPYVEVVWGVCGSLWRCGLNDLVVITSHNSSHEARARVVTLPHPRGSMVEKVTSITSVDNGH